jgi:hypothetical protein
MPNLQRREELKNMLDGFWQYYRLNKTVRPKTYNNVISLNKGARDIFRTMQEMLSESTHGIALKDFGVIVPSDTEIEVNDGLFKREIKIYNSYKFFFENEYLAQFYKVTVRNSKKTKSNVVRTPRPHAVLLHRKKIRKD